MPDEIRILLADDHAILRAGLRALVGQEADIRVVGESGSGEGALDQVKQLQPDIVVMDLDMPGIGGLERERIGRLHEKNRQKVADPRREARLIYNLPQHGCRGGREPMPGGPRGGDSARAPTALEYSETKDDHGNVKYWTLIVVNDMVVIGRKPAPSPTRMERRRTSRHVHNPTLTRPHDQQGRAGGPRR